MTRKINDSIEIVLDFLRKIPLSASTVSSYQDRYKTILAYCESNGIAHLSYSEAQKYIDHHLTRCNNGQISERHYRQLRRAAFLLADCMHGHELVWKSIVFPRKTLAENYEKIIAEYKAYLSPLLAQGTIRGVLSTIRKFLFFLEGSGICDLIQLEADYVKYFIHGVADKHKGSMGDLIWSVQRFLKYLNETNISSVNADRYLLRPTPNRKKVLPCFNVNETNAILSAIDTTTALGKRDYAILKLAIETGLRIVDILNLKRTDIDWRKCEIALIQDKTGMAIQLPLLADVGNAIADYIMHARPESAYPHVFLRTVKPHKKLGNTGCGRNILNRYLDKAGIQHKAWDGKTFHAFRRTHGTRLVEAEVSIPDTADLLGHKILNSAKRYITFNDDKLRLCCLGIAEYATRKEGLA